MLRPFLILAAILLAAALLFPQAFGALIGTGSWFYKSVDAKFTGLAPNAFGALIAGVVALFVLRANVGIGLRNKRVDVILHCNLRYDELYRLRKEVEELKVSKSEEGRALAVKLEEIFFIRYWGLKSDQFDYWLSGYVDPENIVSWSMSTVDHLENSQEGGQGLDYKASLPKMRESHRVTNQRFVDLIQFTEEFVIPIRPIKSRYAAVLQYLNTVEHDERGLIAQITRNSSMRLSVSQFAGTLRPAYMKRFDIFSPLSTSRRIITRAARLWRAVVLGQSNARSESLELNRLCEILKERFRQIRNAKMGKDQ